MMEKSLASIRTLPIWCAIALACLKKSIYEFTRPSYLTKSYKQSVTLLKPIDEKLSEKDQYVAKILS